MIPKLFAATATTFTTQGIGALTDSILCYVDEERNGEYEGYLKYPITGVHYADIALRSIIVAKPNYTDDPQPFRVYDITKPLNGVVTVRFRHISYDLSGYPVEPFTASTLAGALSGLVSNCPVDCPFTLTSSRSVSSTFKANVPASIRSWMGGKAGSLLDIYGGEWKYDGFTASLPSSRGQNRGVTIRYGKNLTALEQEENNAAVYTGVYPYWTDAYGENLVQITGRIVHNTDTPTYSGATYEYERILPVDFSNKWESAPSEGELRSAAIAYIEDNEIGTPKVNLRVEFAQVSKLVRDQVDLCDTVTVQFEKLGVTATAKCIKTRWNVLLDRYEEITLGDAKANLAETIVNTKKTAETAVSPSALEMAVDQATAQITGANGGYYRELDTNGDGKPDETVWMEDSDDIATATKLWRFNYAGLGHSNNGYGGPYGIALTENGAINASMMTVGVLNANIIKAGVLQDAAGINSWNMETGELNLNVAGTVQSITTFYAESINNAAPQWDYPTAYLYDSDGKALYDSDGKRLVAKSSWTTTIPTTATSTYRWMRNLVTYKNGTTQLTSPVPLQDYYGRANLVMQASTDANGNPIGIISGLADYIKFTAGQLEITSPQFTLDRYGNATFAGNLSAASGTFAGELQAATGSFNGAVTATSLTLGSGVTVAASKVSGLATVATSGSYNDLSNKPTIPSLTGYIKTDGTIGSTPSAGSTGFVVSSAGLLQASNAIIYGTLYSSTGTIGGMTLSNNALYHGTNSMTSTTPGVYLGTGGLRIYGSSSNYFNATNAGVVTVKGGSITGSTFLSDDGTVQLDNDGLTVRDTSADTSALNKLEFKLNANNLPRVLYSHRATTSDAWGVYEPFYVDSSNYSYVQGTFGYLTTIYASDVQTGRAIVSNLYLSGESGTAVGTIKTAAGSASSLPSGLNTNLVSLALTKGKWVVVGQTYWQAGGDFQNWSCISTASATLQISTGGHQRAASTASSGDVSMSLTRIIEVTSASQTIYLVGYQDSGSAKSTVYAARNALYAICVG